MLKDRRSSIAIPLLVYQHRIRDRPHPADLGTYVIRGAYLRLRHFSTASDGDKGQGSQSEQAG